ncbi:MAG: hypothetical protein BWY19_00165 [bacterium ADurb.Bin212]|nr:MAG: hypothetical protein BWY19_00165 [bacterium ADurb.Bin212]
MSELLNIDVNRESTRVYCLEKLRQAVEEYDDTIPKDPVPSFGQTDFIKAKVRSGWFMSILGYVDVAHDCGLIPEDVWQEQQQLEAKYLNQDFSVRPTTAEDISEIDGFTRRIISILDSKNGTV